MHENIPRSYRFELFEGDDDEHNVRDLPALIQFLFPDDDDVDFDDEIIHDDRFVEEDDEDNISIDEYSMLEDVISEIVACDVNPHESLVITSGTEGGAMLWLIKEIVCLEYISPDQEITNLKFSHDGSYLGTGSFIGELNVYKVLHHSPEECYTLDLVFVLNVCQYSMRSVAWLRWNHNVDVLFAGGYSGEVLISDIKNKQEYDFDVKFLPGEGESCENSIVSLDGKKLFLLFISKIKIYDIEKINILWIVNTYTLKYKEIVSNIESRKDLSGGTHDCRC